VLSCKKKFLKHLVFGLNRLWHVFDCYGKIYNEHRLYQGIGNKMPAEYIMKNRRQGGGLSNIKPENVTRKEFFGGL